MLASFYLTAVFSVLLFGLLIRLFLIDPEKRKALKDLIKAPLQLRKSTTNEKHFSNDV